MGTQLGGPGVGAGDGVMITGDVRGLARKYYDAGLAIQYDQYDTISHFLGAILWLPVALAWVNDRLKANLHRPTARTSHPGNSLAPQGHTNP